MDRCRELGLHFCTDQMAGCRYGAFPEADLEKRKTDRYLAGPAVPFEEPGVALTSTPKRASQGPRSTKQPRPGKPRLSSWVRPWGQEPEGSEPAPLDRACQCSFTHCRTALRWAFFVVLIRSASRS